MQEVQIDVLESGTEQAAPANVLSLSQFIGDFGDGLLEAVREQNPPIHDGQTDASREVIMDGDPEPWLFQEHYIVARTAGGALSRAGWLAHEHALTDELRWWTLEALRLTDETVFPETIAELLAQVLAGAAPSEPLVLPPADGRRLVLVDQQPRHRMNDLALRRKRFPG